MILRSSLQCESTFKMDLATWMLMTFILFTALAECLSEKGTINVAVGQDVRIPCGIQVQGSFERLVWKSDANSTDHFAFLYGGSSNCNTKKKANCDLSSDGSLELYNVEKTDSGDYFCVVGTDEKYYSQHTLVVHPEVAFETCPNPEDVFVTQTGPDEMVFAYTNPVCKNTDVIGTVTCDPPSGAKIGMNVSKIVCTCSHSGNEVDTCPIPVPAVGIVSAPVTVLGIFIGIIIGAVLGVTIDRLIIIIAYFSKNEGNCKGTTDEEDRPETTELMNTTANSETRESTLEGHSDKTESGKPFTNPNESAVDISDGNTNIDTPNIPSSTELIEVRVDHSSARFEVLPSRTNPTDGLVICCMFDENLTVVFLGQDITTTRKGNRLILNEATVPLHIKCLKCGEYCCSLKICGGEWSEDVKKYTSKDSCEKEDSSEANRVAGNLNSHTGNTYSLKSGRLSH